MTLPKGDEGYAQFASLDIHPQIRLLLACMDNKDADNRLIFLTPAGAAIAFVSFFLPWIQISCLGRSSYSGMDFGGIYWIVLLMSLAIFGAFFLLRKKKRLALLKWSQLPRQSLLGELSSMVALRSQVARECFFSASVPTVFISRSIWVVMALCSDTCWPFLA